MKNWLTTAALVGVLALPRAASAFCGFYVGGAGTELYNNATQVVLMRDGTRTVLSMQNNYQGPPQSFALVVPVPVVLSKENVKTLDREVFSRVDKLDAPRLVEYWEQDPCHPYMTRDVVMSAPGAVMLEQASDEGEARRLGVKVEAKFSVGEYDIVILSATDSAGLETWLKQERYQIPSGAEPYLRPYVQRGSKFFVAKVAAERVKFERGMATLSPLRFHYDSEQFALPIRLGLVNAKDAQDLIVHILAKGDRYEVANYPNVIAPTNLEVNDATRDQFGAFYAALFDRVLQKHPKAIVTEYSWQAGSCDPCPTPPLDLDALAALGADVLPSVGDEVEDPSAVTGSFVLTRLHARYTKESLGSDLVFRRAAAIRGGREIRTPSGALESGGQAADQNNFQSRYIIRHPWTGPITCESPKRGVWGGPPDEGGGRSQPRAVPAQDLAFAPRGKVTLGMFVREDAPELDVKAIGPTEGDPPGGVVVPPAKKSCACGVVGAREGAVWGTLCAVGLAGAAIGRRRRRR